MGRSFVELLVLVLLEVFELGSEMGNQDISFAVSTSSGRIAEDTNENTFDLGI